MPLVGSVHRIFQRIIIVIKILAQLRSPWQILKLSDRVSSIPGTESCKVRIFGIAFLAVSGIELFHFIRNTTRVSYKSHLTHPVGIHIGHIQSPFQIVNPITVRYYLRHSADNDFSYRTFHLDPYRIFFGHPLIIPQLHLRNKNKVLMISHIKVIIGSNTIRLYQRLFCHIGCTR